MVRSLSAAIAAIFLATLVSGVDAEAQSFGFRMPRLPGRILQGPIVRDRGLFRIYSFRRALGAVAVAAVGVAILETLSVSERRDISRRTQRLVRTDPDREVVDTYTVNKGKKQVTIKTSPAKPKSEFEDDPALKPDPKPAPEGGSQANKGGDSNTKKPAVGEEDPSVAFEDLPQQTRCRTQQVEIADTSKTKSDAPPPEAQTNRVVMCELSPDDWKPAKFKQVAAKP